MKRLLTKISFALGMLMMAANNTLAQSPFFNNPQGGTGTVDVATNDTLGGAITRMLNWFLGILGLITVAIVIWAGLIMVTSQGEQEKYDKAKNMITRAATGLIVIILSWTIVQFVVNALTS